VLSSDLKKIKKVILPLLLLTVIACSTHKNTVITRGYHNLTAKYNVLFNGKESFNKGLRSMEENFRDNYAEILPVFQYGNPDVAKAISGDMDRTVKKCSKLISLHSITVKPRVKDTKTINDRKREYFNKKEYNRYVDDAYLLMGKAHFHKHDFGLAAETFRIIINDFKNEPVTYEAQLWLAKVYLENKDYKNTEELLNLLLSKDKFPKQLKVELFLTYTDFYLKQNNYQSSIDYIEKALSLKMPKKQKTRCTYILAQLYERTGNLPKATDTYRRVIKMNPPYIMAFNAHINRALTFQQGSGKSGDIEAELTKMLKDEKNADYLDQIYFALGNLAYKEGDKERAIMQYKKSIQHSTQNTDQKARTYLTLANLYYDEPDYVNAQAYYDSTVALIDPTFRNYDVIYSKSLNLTKLVEEINTFKLEDSVQKLSKLSEPELLTLIDKIIQNVRQEEERKRREESERILNEQYGREMTDQNYQASFNPATGAKWYFYNDAAKNMGYKEFKAKWGNRKLEDHWQRQNKAVSMFMSGNETEEETAGQTIIEKESDNKSREYYLQHIPRNDSMMKASHERLENALLNMGFIYKNDLKDFVRAKESFKELLKRYPLSDNRLIVYYNLYSIAKDEGDKAMMQLYRDKIVAEFPESNYARIMTNPDYIKEIEAEEKKAEKEYEEVYTLFKNGQYSQVILRSDDAIKRYPGNKLMPQFDYIRVLAIGKTADTKVFRDELNEIVARYPNTEVSEAAKNIIAYMNKEHPALLEEEEKTIAEKLYQLSENSEHFVAMIVDKKSNNNQLIFNIINFNLDNFDKENLKIEMVEINSNQNLMLIKSFPDMKKSMQYIIVLKANPNVFKDYDHPSVEIFSISQENLKTLMDDKSTDRYLKFFREHYK
jgi:tetratricopeptide (TPR) repeat protein